jgi:galactofuranose transport system permease protein
MKRLFATTAWKSLQWPLAALALVLLFNLLFTPGFFHLELKDGRIYGSLVDVLNRAAPVMLVSLGMTLVIATGGVDLSVGAVMAIAGSVAALSLTKAGSAVPVVIGSAIGVSAIAGLWNGWLVGFFKIPPIVATLILMVSGRGVAQLLTNGQIITFENERFQFLARGTFLALPFTITLTILVFAGLKLFATRTAAGLFIASTGDNETAARFAGVNTRRVKLFVYSVCSVCAGLAGLIVAADIKAADANNAGAWVELDAILATVVGGTPLQGGRFNLGGSLVGAILIQTLTTTILTRGIAVQYTLVVKALLIIIVCLLQSPLFRATVLGRRRQFS